MAKSPNIEGNPNKDMNDMTISLVCYMQEEFGKMKTRLARSKEKHHAEMHQIYTELKSVHHQLLQTHTELTETQKELRYPRRTEKGTRTTPGGPRQHTAAPIGP